MTDTVTEYPDLARPRAFTQRGLGWVPWLLPVAEEALTDAQRDALASLGIDDPYSVRED